MFGGKSLKRLRSDSMDSRASNASGSPLSRGTSEGYSTVPELSAEAKKAHILAAKIENMTDEQKERFEFFSRSHFDREVVKKYMTEALQHIKTASGDGLTNDVRQRKIDVNEQMVIIMGALCKLFVGDLVRGAKLLQTERGEEGPISPRHIREVYRRAVKKKDLPLLRGKSLVDLSHT